MRRIGIVGLANNATADGQVTKRRDENRQEFYVYPLDRLQEIQAAIASYYGQANTPSLAAIDRVLVAHAAIRDGEDAAQAILERARMLLT